MSDVAGFLHVLDVSKEDQEELSTLLPDGAVSFDTPATAGAGVRDIPNTIAVVSVSLMALRVLAVWITRHTQNQQTEVAVEVRRADGSTKTMVYRSRNSSSQSDADVLRQLASACDVKIPEGSDGSE